ncbi:hypothetical protein HHA02_22040 [Cobetia marina]|nr:hypothetical protein HHA02_22040 [Cobetia marina]
MQQRLTKLILEMTDPTAERGLGDTEVFGASAQVAMAHDGIEGTEALKFVKYGRHGLVAPETVCHSGSRWHERERGGRVRRGSDARASGELPIWPAL